MKQQLLSILCAGLFLSLGVRIVHDWSSGRYGVSEISSPRNPQIVEREMAPPHNRPVIEHNGKTLLWAWGRNPNTSKWFDVTGAKIDPKQFQYGIGVDRIPSIDAPRFAPSEDPRLAEFGIEDRTEVIGYADGDEAKAYPVNVLNRHELVNDRFRGKPITVGW